jgi:hypothetical protein
MLIGRAITPLRSFLRTDRSDRNRMTKTKQTRFHTAQMVDAIRLAMVLKHGSRVLSYVTVFKYFIQCSDKFRGLFSSEPYYNLWPVGIDISRPIHTSSILQCCASFRVKTSFRVLNLSTTSTLKDSSTLHETYVLNSALFDSVIFAAGPIIKAHHWFNSLV